MLSRAFNAIQHACKKIYTATEKGRQELQNWLAKPSKPMDQRNPFLAQLHFSDAIPANVHLHILLKRLEIPWAQILELERRAQFLNIRIPLPKMRFKWILHTKCFRLNMAYVDINSKLSGLKT